MGGRREHHDRYGVNCGGRSGHSFFGEGDGGRCGPGDVWAAWASSEGIASWWNPPATRIDLRIGGPFELLFAIDQPKGRRGSEGCRYLAYVPGEVVSFTWNAPPHLARARRTPGWW